MHYFITGARLHRHNDWSKNCWNAKGRRFYFLLRAESAAKVADLHAYWGLTTAEAQTRAVAIHGDLTLPGLGVSATDVKLLKGKRLIISIIWLPCTTWEPTRQPGRCELLTAPATPWNWPRPLRPDTFTMCLPSPPPGCTKGCSVRRFDEAEGLDHLFQSQARAKSCAKSVGCPGLCTAPRWWWVTAPRARWTKSTALTTSSS